jgi:outer membrane lipoprotein-sorting protein
VRRSVRYLAPLAAAGMVALVASIPSLRAGAAAVNLPAITSQQLLAKVAQADVPAVQGTVSLQADLGIPDLSGLVTGDSGQVSTTNGFDPTSLLSGTHSFEVWSSGQDQRIALPRSMAETDFIRTGSQAWLYDSASQQVTHYVPASPASSGGASGGGSGGPAGAAPVRTPDQEANRLLAQLGPSTDVTAAPGLDVAGQPTYLLTLVPKAGSAGAQESTLSRITISVDAGNGLPLDVAVYAKAVAGPVVELGYTSVSFSLPAASNFAAPVGTSTVTKTIAAGSAHTGRAAPQHASPVSGPAWAQVASLSASTSGLSAEVHSQAVAGATTAVTGTFGTARLLATNVVNALILPDGAVLVGFVNPATLEADASAAAGS